jgi:hypothetical protein
MNTWKCLVLGAILMILVSCTLRDMETESATTGETSIASGTSGVSELSTGGETEESELTGGDGITVKVNVTCEGICEDGYYWFFWKEEDFSCFLIPDDEKHSQLFHLDIGGTESFSLSFPFPVPQGLPPVPLYFLVFYDQDENGDVDWAEPEPFEPFGVSFIHLDGGPGDVFELDIHLAELPCVPESGSEETEESTTFGETSESGEEESTAETGGTSSDDDELVISVNISSQNRNAEVIAEFNGWNGNVVSGTGITVVYSGSFTPGSCSGAVDSRYCEFNMLLKDGQVPLTEWIDGNGDGEVDVNECSFSEDDYNLRVTIGSQTRQTIFGPNKSSNADQCNVWFLRQ